MDANDFFIIRHASDVAWLLKESHLDQMMLDYLKKKASNMLHQLELIGSEQTPLPKVAPDSRNRNKLHLVKMLVLQVVHKKLKQ
ncbi:hypothetical protein DPMN_117262 [Dreissena polymorpha]|uniref:Uncharacterized protein n=1 Tax=Dreissena polymorpha TaxID=45954 RepID=A0A9D4KQX8_DREPO|nr:hypothetical protein DPMN_117262 [Dreissena polymorpha]